MNGIHVTAAINVTENEVSLLTGSGRASSARVCRVPRPAQRRCPSSLIQTRQISAPTAPPSAAQTGSAYKATVHKLLVQFQVPLNIKHVTSKMFFPANVLAWYCLQCFDAVGWAAGRASGL